MPFVLDVFQQVCESMRVDCWSICPKWQVWLFITVSIEVSILVQDNHIGPGRSRTSRTVCASNPWVRKTTMPPPRGNWSLRCRAPFLNNVQTRHKLRAPKTLKLKGYINIINQWHKKLEALEKYIAFLKMALKIRKPNGTMSDSCARKIGIAACFWLWHFFTTVDGRNLAPPGMYKTLEIMGYLPYQLVQDFVHQQYDMCCKKIKPMISTFFLFTGFPTSWSPGFLWTWSRG